MPLYFFDIHDGSDMIDDVGTECVDLREARREAIRASTEILSMSGHDLWSGETWTMKIRNEASSVVGEVNFTAKEAADAVATVPTSMTS